MEPAKGEIVTNSFPKHGKVSNEGFQPPPLDELAKGMRVMYPQRVYWAGYPFKALMAEVQGNRTPLRRISAPHTGFEGRAAHQDRRTSVTQSAPRMTMVQV